MARCYLIVALCAMQAQIVRSGWACSSASGWLDFKDAEGELYPFFFFFLSSSLPHFNFSSETVTCYRLFMLTYAILMPAPRSLGTAVCRKESFDVHCAGK